MTSLFEIIQSNWSGFPNIDLVVLGFSCTAALVFGLIVYMNDSKSTTNRSFLLFLLLTALYATANYLQYYLEPQYALIALRIVIFAATWHAFSLFRLFYVFPSHSFSFPRWYRLILLPYVFGVSVIALTPLVFNRINAIAPTGEISKIINGPLIGLFAITVAGLIIAALFQLGEKLFRRRGVERKQILYVAIGTLVSFSLLLISNLILPAFFDDSRFITLAPIYFLPFIAFTFYATKKHHFLNTKIISAEILTFLLSSIMLFQVIGADTPLLLVLRLGFFFLVLSFGILLMRSVHREVEQRIELERLTTELTDANMKLEDLSRFKTQLLSLASHQIKSPLAAIKGFASILIEGLYGPVNDKVKETLVKMKGSADALVDLINTLLDVRKVEEGRMEYQFARVDIVKLAKDTVEELKSLADQKQLQITFTASAPELYVNADAQKLKQVLQNLIDNSIKYTPKGFVRVALRTEKDTVLFSVADSGLGIPAELIPHLFEEFIRDERLRKEVMGTGLGLYIARKMVEAHSGRIWVESKGVNQGAQFYVALKKIA